MDQDDTTTHNTAPAKVSLAAVREHVRTSDTFVRNVVLDPDGIKVKARVRVVPTDDGVMRRFAEAVTADGIEDEAAAEKAFRHVCDYLEMMVVSWDLDVDPTSDALYATGDGLVVGVFAGWVQQAVTAGPKGISSSSGRSTKQEKTSRKK